MPHGAHETQACLLDAAQKFHLHAAQLVDLVEDFLAIRRVADGGGGKAGEAVELGEPGRRPAIFLEGADERVNAALVELAALRVDVACQSKLVLQLKERPELVRLDVAVIHGHPHRVRTYVDDAF